MHHSSPFLRQMRCLWILSSACCWNTPTKLSKTVRPKIHGLAKTELIRRRSIAGIPSSQSIGSRTSVYTGAFTHDWQLISFKDSEECGTTTALGVQPCVCANRISWFYDFRGNSANIDTACSSSLVALDMGCKDLRNGDVNMVSTANTAL